MFSFAINCFDEELHIFNSIYSIYDLTDDIVIINNNSNDNTDQEINKFIELYDSDKKITYVKENTNLQIAEARNKALNLCKNEFIVKWDGDFINYNVEYCLNYIRDNEKNKIYFDLYLWSAPNFYYDIDYLSKSPTYIGINGDHFISRRNSIDYYSSDKYPDSINKIKENIKINRFLVEETSNNNNYFFFHWYKIKPLKYLIYRNYWSKIHRNNIEYKNIYEEIEKMTGKKMSDLILQLKNDITEDKDKFMIKHNNKIFSDFLGNYNINLWKLGTLFILKDYKNDYIRFQENDEHIEKFEQVIIPKINEKATIYEKSFLMHHRHYKNFKHFTEIFNILDSFLKYKNDKMLVLNNDIYIKIKPLLDILNINYKNIVIINEFTEYNFKNLTYNKCSNEILYTQLSNLSFIQTLIESIDDSENLNFNKYNKIYLQRKLDKGGPIDEDLLVAFLKKQDFEIITFNNESSILEQIYIIYHAQEIISPIGASCNNILFKNKNCIFKCLIPSYGPYRNWGNIYNVFENYKLIECGQITDTPTPADLCNSEWRFNHNFEATIL